MDVSQRPGHDRGVELTLVTPEEAPLGIFGARASEAIRELFETREIALRTQATPLRFEEGVLTLTPAAQIETGAVVALPRLGRTASRGHPLRPERLRADRRLRASRRSMFMPPAT
jgi:hypothetical protein